MTTDVEDDPPPPGPDAGDDAAPPEPPEGPPQVYGDGGEAAEGPPPEEAGDSGQGELHDPVENEQQQVEGEEQQGGAMQPAATHEEQQMQMGQQMGQQMGEGMGQDYTDDNEDDGDFLFNEYSIDDTLDPLTRLERYHTSDFSLQRMVLVREIVDTARDAGHDAAMKRLLPLVGAFVNDSEPAVRQTLAEQLPALAEFFVTQGDGDAGYQELLSQFLPFCFELLSDKNAEVSVAAVTALTGLAEHVRHEHYDQHVFQTVAALARDERTEDYRLIAAQLLAGLSPLLGRELCLEKVVAEVAALADDTAFSVRKTVAGHLGKLCATVGPEAAVEKVFPVYQTLAKDMIWGVRKACAESVADLSAGVTQEVREGPLANLFRQFIEDVSRWVRVAAYQKLGPFLHSFGRGGCSPDLLKLYTEMAFQSENGPDTDYAEYCAFNFPAVALTVGAERWDELEPAFNALVKDVQWKVRKTLSYSLHEIASIVGRESAERCLSQAFDLFLRDLDEVKTGCVSSSAQFLEELGDEMRERYVSMLCQIPEDSDNWRMRQLVGARLGDLAALVSSAFAKAEIVPVATKLLTDAVGSVRQSTFPSVAKLMARLRDGGCGEESELMEFVLKFEAEPSFQHRQMLVYIAKEVQRHARVEVFADHFLPTLRRLAADPVVNVRIAVGRVLVNSADGLLHMERWRDEPSLLEAVRLLKEDKDRDVVHFASCGPGGGGGAGGPADA